MMLGLLISVSFLAHDLAMAGGVPGSDMRVDPRAAPASSVLVVHVTGGEEAALAVPEQVPHQHCSEDACPVESGCEITRVAVPTANDALDATLQSILGELGPEAERRSAVGPRASDAAPFIASRDQRVMFQVFLI